MTGHQWPIPVLLERARQLLVEADAIHDMPMWKRVWYANRAKELTSQAQDLLDEISLRMGKRPNHDGKPQRYGPFTRTHLIVLQWFLGIWNAVTMIVAAVDARWLAAAFSLASMFACTLWVLPRKPRRTHL
jgi:hypothetical protein